MKNKVITGLILGAVCGVIDVIPMIIQKLGWDANLSAFSLWVAAGFVISTSDLKINAVLKGILLSFIILIPTAIIIAWKEPLSLIPISVMTLILGGLLGFFTNKFTIGKKQ